MRRAFFVVGPEGSGTYMLAEAFVAAGCTYCDKDDVKEFLRDKKPDKLVLRRSLPHAGKWPNLEEIAMSLMKMDYAVEMVAIVRDSKAAFRSIYRRRPEGKSFREHFIALEYISKLLTFISGRMISYEYFVLAHDYRRAIMEGYGLKDPEMEFYDGNKQYY